MSSNAGPARAKGAIDRITRDQQKLVREHHELAASNEDGPDRTSESWLDAKFHQDFADYIAKYDPQSVELSLSEVTKSLLTALEKRQRRDWLRWRRFLL
jgi:hypothetical protein